jgi:hypothetical protein
VPNRIQQGLAGLRTSKMKTRILAMTVLVVALSCIGRAQSKDMLIGTWKLTAVSNVTDKGVVKIEVYGRGGSDRLN